MSAELLQRAAKVLRDVVLMSPPVALALADWLEKEAKGVEFMTRLPATVTKVLGVSYEYKRSDGEIEMRFSTLAEAEAVARAILREPEEASTDA